MAEMCVAEHEHKLGFICKERRHKSQLEWELRPTAGTDSGDKSSMPRPTAAMQEPTARLVFLPLELHVLLIVTAALHL